MQYNYIAIEGNIGSGKTSFAKMLSEDLDAQLLLEQFEDNPFLANFYKDPDRYSFQVEMSFLTERYYHLKKELINKDIFQPLTISDYFINKCQIFGSSNLKDDELKLFNALFSIINTALPKPDLIVYLYVHPENLIYNISKRGRKYEEEIKQEYLSKIHQGYFEHFKQLKNSRILIVDTNNVDFVNKKSDYNRLKKVVTSEIPIGITREIL